VTNMVDQKRRDTLPRGSRSAETMRAHEPSERAIRVPERCFCAGQRTAIAYPMRLGVANERAR